MEQRSLEKIGEEIFVEVCRGEETKKELEPEIINNNDENDEEDDESDEEETLVVPFVFKGVKYLKAADNTIYDINTHEEIGVWDEIKQEIVEDEE